METPQQEHPKASFNDISDLAVREFVSNFAASHGWNEQLALTMLAFHSATRTLGIVVELLVRAYPPNISAMAALKLTDSLTHLGVIAATNAQGTAPGNFETTLPEFGAGVDAIIEPKKAARIAELRAKLDAANDSPEEKPSGLVLPSSEVKL